jgi:hypothetical protein
MINSAEPRLVAPDTGDFSPESSGTVPSAPCYVIPPFPNDDRPKSPSVPQLNPDNTVRQDYYGNSRGVVCVHGAILSGTAGSLSAGSARPGTPISTAQIQDTSPVFPATTPALSLPESVCIAGFVIGLFILHNRPARPR